MKNSNTVSNRQSGFTLIELVVVIAIIALLAAIVLSSFDVVQFKAHDARRISDIESVQKSLELYYIAHSRYPDANANGCGWDVGNATRPFMQGTGIEPDFGGGVPPVDIFKFDACSGYRYYRYPAGSYGCPASRGAFYVLGVTDMQSEPWPYPGSPGFSCPGRDWQNEFDWVAGQFEN
jgi:prepilin-type N-terminal cleavage/methylation domain-containing protein